MSSHITLAAQPRDESITTRALRRQQLVPGVVYGRISRRAMSSSSTAVERAIHRAGTSQCFALTIAGEQEQYLTGARRAA